MIIRRILHHKIRKGRFTQCKINKRTFLMTKRRFSIQPAIHLQSKTIIRRRLLNNKIANTTSFYTRKDDIKTFIDYKNRLLNHQFYIYTVKMMIIRRILHRKIRKGRFTQCKINKRTFLNDKKTSFLYNQFYFTQ